MVNTSVSVAYVRGEITVIDYWKAAFPDSAFDEQCCELIEWAEHFRAVVNSGFWRMDALDRLDPFWMHTNGLATVSKLHDFANYERGRNPSSVYAAWLSIAVNLFHGRDHLDSAPWKVLFNARVAEPRLPICTAYSMSPYWTDGCVGRVVVLARDMNLESVFEHALNWLASRGTMQAGWSNDVLHALNS
ncbi:hypothetical protein [Massilia sp. TWP1-3-3]|uniref:hypothetical protein n=1 Tax=Massilia sp. TWP1-3-3 TaxID=2804573 RepID=UPI003CE69B4B